MFFPFLIQQWKIIFWVATIFNFVCHQGLLDFPKKKNATISTNSVPRWYGNHHPLNLALAKVPKNGSRPSAPKLEPFPSWDMQKLGDCSAIQFVQSMQVGCWVGGWMLKGTLMGATWCNILSQAAFPGWIFENAFVETFGWTVAHRWRRRRRCSGYLTMVENFARATPTPVLPSKVGKNWKIG